MISLSRRKLVLAGLALLLTAGAFGLTGIWWSKKLQAKVDLPAGVSLEEFKNAEQAWILKHGRMPAREDVLVTLADAYALEGKLEPAVACYDAIPSAHPRYGLGARLEQAKALIRLYRAAEAERNLREFITVLAPDSAVSRQQILEVLDLLRFLLDFQLRFEERVPVLNAIQEMGDAGKFDTLVFCFPSLLRWNGPQAVQWLEKFWKETPGDFRLRVALGRYRCGEGRLEEATAILEQCCQEQPESLPAWSALLACYYEQANWEKVEAAFARLPPRSPDDPWLLLRMRGHYHNEQGNFAEAEACFRDALASDPANAESYSGLARAYQGLGREDERAEALRKMQALARVQSRLGWAISQDDAIDPLLETIALCQEIGLDDQARRVAQLAVRLAPDNPAARTAWENLQRPKAS